MMPSAMNAYDIKIVHGSTTIEARLARDDQGRLMWRRGSAPTLMEVASTEPDVTYAQIPRNQGAEVAIEGVGGGAGAYYYQAGKYSFGESVATEGGLVYPGPEVTATTVVPSTEAAETINGISIANPSVITTTNFHTFQTGDTVTISGSTTTPSINGAHVITRLSTTTFSIPVNVTSVTVFGSVVLTGLAALDGVVAAWTQYNGVDFIAAGKHVYMWDTANSRWRRIHTAPGSETYGAGANYNEPPATITDITWFRTSSSDLLLIAFGNENNPYGFSTLALSSILTGGSTLWSQADVSTRPFSSYPWYYPKYWTKKERGLTTPQVLGAVDPDVIYASTQPLSATATWDTGTRVGFAGTGNEFTSLTTAPVTGEVLVGKKEGLRTFDNLNATIMAFGPVPRSNGEGAQNFLWPASLGGKVYYPVNDYDIIEYSDGTITPGFGVARAGPRVPEMQKPIVALASDGLNHLYAALGGADGYIMRGQRQDDEKWHWHGAYIKLGQAIARMWLSAQTGSDTEAYLKIAPTASPYLPYRALIPRVDLQTASTSQAKFATSGKIRFGYLTAGLAHQIKVLSHSTINGLNQDANNYWRLDYRKDGESAYTTGSNFTSTGQKQYYPAALAGVRFELQAVYVGQNNTKKPAIEAIVSRLYRRPVRLNTFEMTVLAETGVMTSAGGSSLLSSEQLYDEIDNLRNGYALPLLTDPRSGNTWAVDVESITEQWLEDANGPGRTRVLVLRCQELETVDNPRQQTAYAG